MKYFQPELETMSAADRRALQSERLVSTVKYVYERQKPYREKMDAIKLRPSDIKGIEDIWKLPYTQKSDLRNSYPFGMMAATRKELVRLHASSATTGKLTVSGYTKHDIDVWADCAARSLVMAGADEESIVHVCYGYGLFTGGLGMHYGAEKLGAIAVPASAGNTQRQLQLLADFGADLLHSLRHAAAAGLLLVLGDLSREIKGRGSGPAGVGKDMHLQKALSLYKSHAVQKVLLRLPGKAYDDIGGQAGVLLPEGGAQLGGDLGVLLGGVGAAHGPQRPGAAVLQAQVKLGAELGQGRHASNV